MINFKTMFERDHTTFPVSETPRFIADCHLGKLAKYLRFMGYDTLYFPQIEDSDLIRMAQEDDRVILTRDRELSMRKSAPVFYLEPFDIATQLKRVTEEFKLGIGEDESRRCLICNTLLQTIEKRSLPGKVPERVKEHFTFFQQCPECKRIYWHGDHYKSMMDFLKATLSV